MPNDAPSGRDPYFAGLEAALRRAGVAQASLVIDRDRLDANLDTLACDLPRGMAYRIVVKSLPALDLVRHVRARTGSDRLMTFNAAMLKTFAHAMPDADQLLGKPLPVAAARTVLASLPQPAHAALARIHWLIDTPERLAQYAALADGEGVDLNIALELDVGLHRGGFTPDDTLDAALQTLAGAPRLTLTGCVGYEPHLTKLPEVDGWRAAATEGAWTAYREALSRLERALGPGQADRLIRNAGGSPTFRLYRDTQVANELSVGSVLVKPSDFDTPELAGYQPAAFIATPVLKTWPGVHAPGLEHRPGAGRTSRLPSAPGAGRTLFLHGGNWLADPVDPPGLAYSKLFGRSSNQEMLTAPEATVLAPDDLVFLRPRQSEAVLLQFGDLVVVSGGEVVDTWPALPASA